MILGCVDRLPAATAIILRLHQEEYRPSRCCGLAGGPIKPFSINTSSVISRHAMTAADAQRGKTLVSVPTLSAPFQRFAPTSSARSF
jgi:hypothetical protein